MRGIDRLRLGLTLNVPLAPDARLILSDDALDQALELFLLAEAALWTTADGGLDGDPQKLGRSHYRAAFLLKRRPGLGVRALAQLTGLSKQGASRVLKELTQAGYIETRASDTDARRRPAHLTETGRAFEARISHRMRAALAKAYRLGGLDKAPAATAVLGAIAAGVRRDEEEMA